ncbi:MULTISPECIES: FAD:protein FMN transferase [unclassified Aeromicrobium]|uniref:FAD:protein FMN transferase n=1 Tax=unclassified Aeromicrobium TaxID=2633570 RepID=UPI00209718EF|nr:MULTISPECIES: FAD:protein FMN transferase [unclassified Aeromicrobium]MCO7240389.1 FAD:protein FMN transferase [Aeromicrobium sp. CnD17-E]MDR6118116.1 thiamine biosynthesis lipoprotein [Aeromicrobium sp. SORGH_AS_0981]
MTGIGPRATTVAWDFEAIGAPWQVETARPLAPDVRQAVLDVVDRFDRTWSRFRDDSVVTAMAGSAGAWSDVDSAGLLLDLYDGLHRATDGSVTPLVGQALVDLGYDADYSLVQRAEPAVPDDWAALRSRGEVAVGPDGQVRTSRPLLLDVGAAGKGLLVDLVVDVLADHGVDQATVDGSGDLRHVGAGPIRVALEHPGDASRAVGVVEVADGWALCASAVNRRAWGDGLHHVVDGRTGHPTRDVVATWTLVDGSCMVADGLATAHFFADPQALLDLHPHHFVRIHADGRVLRSPDLPGELFT